jgi:UPF0755 protein
VRRLAASLSALLCAALAALLALGVRDGLVPPGPGQDPVLFVVAPGAGLRRVARELEAAGLVRSALAFEGLARWRGQARQLHAGEYELAPALTAGAVLERLVAGRVVSHEVVIPPGFTAAEVATRLGAAGLVDPQAFLGVVRDAREVAALGVEGTSLEGYLFPETYHLGRGFAPREVARIMVEQFLSHWRPLAPVAAARGLDMARAVTLASIVEKETGSDAERPLVAAVLHNRLRLGMRLQVDPTVIYGIQDFDGNLTRAHLEDAGNPYNTYQIAGLPPGPIGSPGFASLRAVVEPADTDHLYYVSRNDGTHQFSRTLRDHEAAVTVYQRRRR